VTSSKAFEDRATHILNEMRKQRRSLQLEYVAKVWIHYRVSHFKQDKYVQGVPLNMIIYTVHCAP